MKLTEREELIDRGRKFWNREPTDRPMVGVLFNRMEPLSEFAKTHSEPLLKPAHFTNEIYLADLERRHAAIEQIGGDAPFVAFPFVGFPFMDAIMGCTIDQSGPVSPLAPAKIHGLPLQSDWKEYGIDSVPWDNGWFDLLQRNTSLAIKASAGRFPVGAATLGGVGESISTLIGETDFSHVIKNHPDSIRRLTDVYVQVWTKVVSAQYELLEPDSGGYWNSNQPVWSPGKTMFIPADVAGKLSPDMFEEFFLEPMEQMLEGYDYCILHTHSTYIESYPLDRLIAVDQLKAVQLAVDANGPSIEELLPKFRHVLERCAMIINGELTGEDIRYLIKKLPHEGLFILCNRETVAEGRAVLDIAFPVRK